MKILKGKDNYKPVKQIYKVKYIYREIGYVRNHLSWWKSEIMSELNSMRMIVNNHEDFFSQQKTSFRKRLEQDGEYNKIKNPKDRAEYLNQNYLDESLSVYTLPFLQRNSALITIFSLVEGNLDKISTEFEICLKSPIRLKDMMGKGTLINYWNFFSNVIDLDIQDLSESFSRLKDYYYIRNRIVHSNGIVKDENKARELQSKFESIKIHEHIYFYKLLIQDDSFLESLIDTLVEFFEKLYGELDRRINDPVPIHIDENSKLSPIIKQKKE